MARKELLTTGAAWIGLTTTEEDWNAADPMLLGTMLAPVLRGVQGMPLSVLNSHVSDLAERARTGRIQQSELEGGSFSVSNLGMYGVKEGPKP
jgi:pyruvate/2-oxoglutarate dehydrogenase complex dihydrolipoamide acyltransferase (E2) component